MERRAASAAFSCRLSCMIFGAIPSLLAVSLVICGAQCLAKSGPEMAVPHPHLQAGDGVETLVELPHLSPWKGTFRSDSPHPERKCVWRLYLYFSPTVASGAALHPGRHPGPSWQVVCWVPPSFWASCLPKPQYQL